MTHYLSKQVQEQRLAIKIEIRIVQILLCRLAVRLKQVTFKEEYSCKEYVKT